MLITNNFQTRTEWQCKPNDWEGVAEIRISISQNGIIATYYKSDGTHESESYPITHASEGEGGVSTLTGTPFSLFRFGTGRKLIISRSSDHQGRSYSYIFTIASS